MDYEAHGEAYSADNDTNLFNRYYERPAMLALAGDVAGQHVLDAGCGHGPLIGELRGKGAAVCGFDKSPTMVRLAKERLGEDIDVRVADLEERLPYDDNTFDTITCSLALHYAKDWSGPLTELKRILKPAGRLLVSVNHPTTYGLSEGENYFATTEHSFEAELGGKDVTYTVWHRPLSAMAGAFVSAGFHIDGIDEPHVADDAPDEILPEPVRKSRRFCCMLFFTLTPMQNPA